MARVTKHAKSRMHDRIGITKGIAQKHAGKILREGIKHEDTMGDLHKWMDAEFLRYHTANNMRYYAGRLYIFNGELLITVLQDTRNLEDSLSEYVKEEAYARYCKFRKSKTSKQINERKNTAMREKEIEVLEDLKMYVLEHDIGIEITNVSLEKPWLVRVNYVSDTNFLDWIRYGDIVEYIKKTYEIGAYLRKVRASDGRFITIDEWRSIQQKVNGQ